MIIKPKLQQPNKPVFLKTNLALISFLFLSSLLSCTDSVSSDSSPTTHVPSLTQTTEHTVTFDSKGGSAVSSQVVKNGEIIKKPVPNPTRTNYIFVGWYKESSFTNIFDFNNTPINTDTIVYAKWNYSSLSIIETIKATKKVDLFNINAPLYDRKGNKIKDKEAPLAYSKIFPSVDQVINLYGSESGYSTIFELNIRLANAIGVHGFNVNRNRGAPYFLFVLDNKIYLNDEHYIQLTFDREETYMKEASGSVWETPASALLYWMLEKNSIQSNNLNGYAGYVFSSFPRGTTDPDKTIKLRSQITSSSYVPGNNYTLQLTLKQKLVSPNGETQLENHMIQKTFTTAGGSGVSRFRGYSPDVFFQVSNTYFPY